MQNDELLPVTEADEKRADDWAMMLGRMGGVILDQSQRRGLAAQFAAHRIESTRRAAPSGEEKCTVCGIANQGHHVHTAPFTENYHQFSGEGRSNGAGEDDVVEKIARIIAPSAWAVFDAEKSRMLRKYKGENIGWPADQYRHKASMDTARTILAALAQPKGGDHG